MTTSGSGRNSSGATETGDRVDGIGRGRDFRESDVADFFFFDCLIFSKIIKKMGLEREKKARRKRIDIKGTAGHFLQSRKHCIDTIEIVVYT